MTKSSIDLELCSFHNDLHVSFMIVCFSWSYSTWVSTLPCHARHNSPHTYCSCSPDGWWICKPSFFNELILNGVLVTELNLAFDSQEEKAKVVQTILFVAGINTLLQTTFGTRLPAVIGASYTFVPTTISIILSGRFSDTSNPIDVMMWHFLFLSFLCESFFVLLLKQQINHVVFFLQRFERIMRATQGALIVASTLQMILGFSGLWRNVVRLV